MFLICCVISTKFGGCRHYVIGEIMVFVHHVTLQDHVTKALNNFMVRSLWRFATFRTNFVGNWHCGSKNVIILVCHVISHNHVTCDLWKVMWLMSRSLSSQVTILPSLVVMATLLIENNGFCQVILQDHVIKSFIWLHGKEPLRVSPHPTKFSGYRHYGRGDIMVLVYQVILQDRMIKGSFDFIDRSLWR